jgi:hypothetical protein
MKSLPILATLIIFISCSDPAPKVNKVPGWAEEQKIKYFADTFAGLYGFGQFGVEDSTKTFAHFFKTHYPNIKTRYGYDPFPYAFEEEYVDTTKIDSSRHWFRLMVIPCFRRPYCFTLEKKYNKSLLTTKITSGNGGYNTGVLVSTTKFSFGDTLYDNISMQLKSLNFWKLNKDTTCLHGTDGEVWTFEVVENGKYNIISRWAPQDCGDSVTKQLSYIGIHLAKLSRLDNILVAIGARRSDIEQ